MKLTKYGSLPEGDGEDIRGAWSLSLDVRTGAEEWLPPGTMAKALFPTQAGSYPVGQVKIEVGGYEVVVVGALTGRPGIREVAVEHLRAAFVDPTYRKTLTDWLGIAC